MSVFPRSMIYTLEIRFLSFYCQKKEDIVMHHHG